MIAIICPHCNQHIEADDEWAGLTVTCPTCSKEFTAPTTSRHNSASDQLPEAEKTLPGYGLSPSDPIMTGMGPRGANRYFRHLRCPTGSEVSYQRKGSLLTRDLSYIERRRGWPDAVFGSECSSTEVNVDHYLVTCGCGQHQLEVFVDMYHQTLDACIDVEGWTFVSAFPDGRTLAAGQFTTREPQPADKSHRNQDRSPTPPGSEVKLRYPVICIHNSNPEVTRKANYSTQLLRALAANEPKDGTKEEFYDDIFLIDSDGVTYQCDRVEDVPKKPGMLAALSRRWSSQDELRLVGVRVVPTPPFEAVRQKVLALIRYRCTVDDFGPDAAGEVRAMVVDVSRAATFKQLIHSTLFEFNDR